LNLKACDTGHRGGVPAVHGNSPLHGLYRLEQLVQEATANIAKDLIADAVNRIIYIERNGIGRMVRQTAGFTESMAIPCSANAIGTYRAPPQLEVTICDPNFLSSCFANSNIKSSGNRSMFLRTCSDNLLVSTPQTSAKFRSSMTLGQV